MPLRATVHDGLAAVELRAGDARLVIVHAIGPRIAWLGRDANLLYWDAAGAHTRGAWSLRGGHRLWVTRPGADESEEAYAPDDRPCRVRELRGGVAVTAPRDAAGLEKALVVRAAPGGWTVEHRVRNAGDMLWSGGLWALTCTRPERSTRYRIPLDGGPPDWDVTTLVIPRRWGGTHRSRLADPQFELTEAALVVRPRGVEAKRMISAPRGTLIMADRARGTFTKRARFEPRGCYPRATNVAVYVGPASFMVELETMSPLHTLRPGETLRHVEAWSLDGYSQSIRRS
jgi:hypothetical protein